MRDAWSWIAGIIVALCILGLVAYGRSERRAYWVAHDVAMHVVRQEQPRLRSVHPETRLWRGMIARERLP